MRQSVKVAGWVLAAQLAFSCSATQSLTDPQVICHNGIFVGTTESATGVYVFHAIPFAKQPVEDLRWKMPQEAAMSAETYEAKRNGPVALQNILPTDSYIKPEMLGEACLHLNLWTANLTDKKKPVFVYIHGGSYGWETAECPIYSLQYLAKANPDMVFVSPNYRVNIMGFADFSKVPEGKRYKKSDFVNTQFLGLLDVEMALRWIHRNIAAFGGDPENVTICGESAGGGIVSILSTRPSVAPLVRRAIAMSGSSALTYDQKKYERLDQMTEFLKASGAKNLDELMALPEKTILDALNAPTERVGTEGTSGVGNLNNHPLRGKNGVIANDPFKEFAKKPAAAIDFMVGTVSDEWRYWVLEMEGRSLEENFRNYNNFLAASVKAFRQKLRPKEQKALDRFFKIVSTECDSYAKKYPDIWKNTAFQNELYFRLPAIREAEFHSVAPFKKKGKTYMYYFTRPSTKYDWMKAAHAEELNYLFAHPEAEKTDPVLVQKMSTAFMNFARTGDPGFGWEPYDTKHRYTMRFAKEGVTTLLSDPLKKERELLMPLIRHTMQ